MDQMQSSHGLDIVLSVFGAEPAGDSALACASSILSLHRILKAVNSLLPSETWVSSGFAMLASGLSSNRVIQRLRWSSAQALLQPTAMRVNVMQPPASVLLPEMPQAAVTLKARP